MWDVGSVKEMYVFSIKGLNKTNFIKKKIVRKPLGRIPRSPGSALLEISVCPRLHLVLKTEFLFLWGGGEEQAPI